MQLSRIAGELLAERERRGILQMGAAYLDEIGEFAGLGLQTGVQLA